MLAGQKPARKVAQLFAHYFHDDTLVALSIEFRVENTLPRAEVESPCRNRNDYLVVNEQCFQMGVAICFARIVMPIVFAKWRQLLEPLVDVFNQSAFVVIYVNTRSDVHGRNQHHTFLYATFSNDRFDLRSEVNVFAVLASVELQIFGVGFHGASLRYRHTKP
jgi:hypothetical protein